MSSAQDITWTRGQTEEWTLAITNADGTALNLSTALAVEFEVKPYEGAPDPATLHLDLTSGITLRTQIGADVGVCDLVATSAQVFTLSYGKWAYDVFVTRADGARKRVVHGQLTLDGVVNFP